MCLDYLLNLQNHGHQGSFLVVSEFGSRDRLVQDLLWVGSFKYAIYQSTEFRIVDLSVWLFILGDQGLDIIFIQLDIECSQG